jgi:hypothetical protein
MCFKKPLDGFCKRVPVSGALLLLNRTFSYFPIPASPKRWNIFSTLIPIGIQGMLARGILACSGIQLTSG